MELATTSAHQVKYGVKIKEDAPFRVIVLQEHGTAQEQRAGIVELLKNFAQIHVRKQMQLKPGALTQVLAPLAK